MSDLDDTLRDNLAAPAKASGNSGSMEQHKITDQLAVAKALDSNDAISKPAHRGIRFNKIVPGGPV